jgi:hypothetical protein
MYVLEYDGNDTEFKIGVHFYALAYTAGVGHCRCYEPAGFVLL